MKQKTLIPRKRYRGDDPDPIGEAVEIAWLSFLRRFDEAVYPQLYANRGISKDAALVSWQLSFMQGELEKLSERVQHLETIADP